MPELEDRVDAGGDPFEAPGEGVMGPSESQGEPPLRVRREKVLVVEERRPRRGRPAKEEAPPREETPAEKIDRENAEAWETRLAHLSDDTPWYVRRVGPPRDSKGRRVEMGIYAEDLMTGPCSPHVLKALVGGGIYQVTLEDPRDGTAKWSKPIRILGDPKPISLHQPEELGDPANGPAIVQTEDEYVPVYDNQRGCVIKVPRDEAEFMKRQQVPAAVQKQMDMMAEAQKQQADLMKAIVEGLNKPPQKNETLEQFFTMERERMRADADRARDELKIAQARIDAAARDAREARQADLDRARIEAEAIEKRYQLQMEALEKRLDAEREAAREAQAQIMDLMAKSAQQVPREDAMGSLVSSIEALKSLTEIMPTGSSEAPAREPSMLEKAGEFIEKVGPIFQQWMEARQRALQQPVTFVDDPPQPAPAQRLPAPVNGNGHARQAQPQAQNPQPAPAAPPQAPQPTARRAAAMSIQDAINHTLSEVVRAIDTGLPPSTMAANIVAEAPAFAKQIVSANSADDLLSELQGLGGIQGFEPCKPHIDKVLARASAGKKPWINDFLASLKQKVR